MLFVKLLSLVVYASFHANLGRSIGVDYSCVHSESWLMNADGDYSETFSTSTDVTSSERSSDEWVTTFSRIPNYDRIFTEEDIEELNSRPNAATDFATGSTTASAGSKYAFGDDIGYTTNGPQGCELGYWPPGPVCPNAATSTYNWDLSPTPEEREDGCYTPMLGAIGYWVNGVSIFGISDGETYNNEGVWYNSAPEFERYDLDVCAGHAANNEYHHHNHPTCLQERLGDTGTAHSPVYGWLLDSYPIYGPYQASGVTAESCWKKRDYSSTATGCSDGTRSCQLIDQYDYTQGTTNVTSGPSLSGTVTTQSGNTLSAMSGIYFEDYYFDTSCYAQNAGADGSDEENKYLDSSNGHSHGDYGYHYHTTLDSAGDFAFPYTAGPKYYGCRASACCTSKEEMNCSNSYSECGTNNSTSIVHKCSSSSSSSAAV